MQLLLGGGRALDFSAVVEAPQKLMESQCSGGLRVAASWRGFQAQNLNENLAQESLSLKPCFSSWDSLVYVTFSQAGEGWRPQRASSPVPG